MGLTWNFRSPNVFVLTEETWVFHKHFFKSANDFRTDFQFEIFFTLSSKNWLTLFTYINLCHVEIFFFAKYFSGRKSQRRLFMETIIDWTRQVKRKGTEETGSKVLLGFFIVVVVSLNLEKRRWLEWIHFENYAKILILRERDTMGLELERKKQLRRVSKDISNWARRSLNKPWVYIRWSTWRELTWKGEEGAWESFSSAERKSSWLELEGTSERSVPKPGKGDSLTCLSPWGSSWLPSTTFRRKCVPEKVPASSFLASAHCFPKSLSYWSPIPFFTLWNLKSHCRLKVLL